MSDLIPVKFQSPNDALKFYSVSGEKRKCMICKGKKEKGNGNVFCCNNCKPKRYYREL